MNKMLVAVFDSETAAFEGLSALKDLHKDKDITLYATTVLTKDASGKVTTKQVADPGPIGTGLGLLAGSMVGLLAGPVGLVVGASMGSLTGMILDLNKAGIDIQFVDDVSKALGPGRAAVMADLDEDWTAPVDTRIGNLGGLVFRRLHSEVVEDQLAREAAAFKAELKQLQEEMAHARAENKAVIQKQIDDVNKKLRVTRDQIQARIDQASRETDAKISALQEQIKQANDRQKAKIEKRVAELKADFEVRRAKLQEAGRLVKEAVAV